MKAGLTTGLRIAALPIALVLAGATPVPQVPDLGPQLERFTYPWPVQTMEVDIVGSPAQMAFMDIAPQRPNGRTVVLLHGKNFCGATWGSAARALSEVGYRVIVPDQIGFCKSSKPRATQYSFEMLTTFTKRLLESRGITRATIVGHSMGGMLAMRYAILYPASVEKLVLVNPLGLKDRSEEGVPYADVDTLWANEKKTGYASIKAYQLENYYHGVWKPSYDRWVWMQAGMYQGAGRDTVALAQAKTSEMIKTQPVAHELYRITPPDDPDHRHARQDCVRSRAGAGESAPVPRADPDGGAARGQTDAQREARDARGAGAFAAGRGSGAVREDAARSAGHVAALGRGGHAILPRQGEVTGFC